MCEFFFYSLRKKIQTSQWLKTQIRSSSYFTSSKKQSVTPSLFLFPPPRKTHQMMMPERPKAFSVTLELRLRRKLMSNLQVGDPVSVDSLLRCQLSQRQSFIIDLEGFRRNILHPAEIQLSRGILG